MLNAITLESSRAAVIHVHRQRHGDGTLRIHQPIAMVSIDVQVIGDDRKLIAGHLEHVVVVNSHESEPGMLEHSREKFRCYFVAIPALRQIESVKSGSTTTGQISFSTMLRKISADAHARARAARSLPHLLPEQARPWRFCRHLRRPIMWSPMSMPTTARRD